MKCPVCGGGCVKPAKDIRATLSTIFLPCEKCNPNYLNKRLPLPSLDYVKPCSCGKRFIDDVFAHMYVIMVEEGDLRPTDPLIDVGSPLVHPGFAMDSPPFLPAKSLLILTTKATKKTAIRLVDEVPELRGVIKKGDFIPGIANPDLESTPKIYDLLAGCDVRADIFPLATGPLVVYKQQTLIHIEFPRVGYHKIRSVEKHVGKPPVNFFIDACSGVGTLGLAAACLGVPHVIMNDAWYASAFWSAINLDVNREYFRVDDIKIFERLNDMMKHPVGRSPVLIAETEGDQKIEVYQGDFQKLHEVISPGASSVTAVDLFDKNDILTHNKFRDNWARKVGGEIFIP